jgi:hypothetical protein
VKSELNSTYSNETIRKNVVGLRRLCDTMLREHVTPKEVERFALAMRTVRSHAV